MRKVLNKQQIAFELIQDLLVSLSLTVTAFPFSGTLLLPPLVIKETGFAWLINLLIGFSVPEQELGAAICRKLHLKQPISHFFTMFIVVLINVLGISLCVVLKNTGFHMQFFRAWVGLLPILLLAGYFTALIFFPVTGRIVRTIFRDSSDE